MRIKTSFQATMVLLRKTFQAMKIFYWKKETLTLLKAYLVLIGGSLPPNPVQLLTNGRLEQLLEEAKKTYDYIIMDCAHTLLVT